MEVMHISIQRLSLKQQVQHLPLYTQPWDSLQLGLLGLALGCTLDKQSNPDENKNLCNSIKCILKILYLDARKLENTAHIFLSDCR